MDGPRLGNCSIVNHGVIDGRDEKHVFKNIAGHVGYRCGGEIRVPLPFF